MYLFIFQTTMTYIMYNDQTPNGKISSNRGHTKGTLCF
jgi:hypothetical protein